MDEPAEDASCDCDDARADETLWLEDVLDERELRARLSAHLVSHYTTLVSILKGVGLASGGIALWTIASHAAIRGEFFVACSFWLTSLIGVVLTYDAILVGTLVMHWVGSMWDVLIPFTVGGLEFLLFIVLTAYGQHHSAAHTSNALDYWLLTYGLWAVAGMVNVVVVRSNVMNRSRFAPSLKPLADKYAAALRIDIIAASSASAVALATFGLLRAIGPSTSLQLASGCVLLVFTVGGLVSQEKMRLLVAREVTRQ